MSAVVSPALDLRPLTLRHRGEDALTIPVPLFLAPMEGVTVPSFRHQLAQLGGVGVVCTDFVRISQAPIGRKTLQRRLGPRVGGVVTGLQFMLADETHLPACIAASEDLPCDFIDLNFGCPAPKVFSKCAGSGLLAFPERLHDITRVAVQASDRPITVKLRTGINDTSLLFENLHAVTSAGASLVTLHGRLRSESYAQQTNWQRLADANAWMQAHAPRVPFIGNGSVHNLASARELLALAPCNGLMIGTGAIADPWVFNGLRGMAPPQTAEAKAFLLQYAENCRPEPTKPPRLGPLKQLIKYWRSADLFADDEVTRQLLLRAQWSEIAEWLQAS